MPGTGDNTVPDFCIGTDDWQPRWTNAAKNWRKLQLNAVQGIQSVVPNATILVSTYDAFPESYYSDPAHKIPDPEKYPIQTTRYLPSECGVSNLIYKVHIFEPFRYTHSLQQDPIWQGGYNESRDFFGMDDNPNDPYSVPVSWDQFHPLLGQIQEAISWILNWRMAQRNVKMLVTGFGVNEVNRPNDFPDPLIEGEPIWQSTPDKATWLHDVRRALESNNIGWTVFEYLGGFATHYGKWNPPYAHQYHLRDSTDRSMVGAYRDALLQ